MYHDIQHILFLDIETVSQHQNFNELPERVKPLWKKKASYYIEKEEKTVEEAYNDRAAVMAEFGKVIVISIGYFARVDGEWTFRVKAIAGHNEKELLEEFCLLLGKFEENLLLCAHNGKEFDFPYLCRRLLLNGLPIPYALDLSGKKPWEVQHLDTMHLWRFGDYKHFTSLDTLAAIFDIPSSKSDLDGSLVGKTYYEDNDLKRIVNYCKQDVVVTAQVFLRMKALPILEGHQIILL